MSEIDYTKQYKNVATDCIKCPGCGGTLIFDPDTQTLKCEHCGNTVDFEKDKSVKENDINEGFDKAERWDTKEQVTYKCDNCGAKIIINADEEATVCPFCGTTHIVRGDGFEGIRPQAVLPFAFGTDKATAYSKKWAKSRIFAPRKFKKNLNQENMRGVYEPCFTFDSNTYSTYSGRVGYRRTRTVGSGKNRRTETYIEYKNISGTYSQFFDDVLIANSENFDQSKINMLSPFQTANACVYEKSYLSGFVADGYTRSLRDGWQSAKKEMDSLIRSGIKQEYNADVVDYLNVSTSHEKVTYKYILLPVYYMTYKYGKKRYGIMVNGNSGKVKGKTPVSPLRVLLAVLLGAAVVIGAAYLFMRYGSFDSGEVEFAMNTAKNLLA